MLCVGMPQRTLRVRLLGRRASRAAFPRRAWERSKAKRGVRLCPESCTCEGRFMLKFLALLTLLASTAVHAQTPLQTDLPLKYLEQANSESRHQPLVIFLHGFGSNEE